MIRNYFKTAFRNLYRNKGYAIINIGGLAIALAACIIIFLVIQFETSYDSFQKNGDQIYQIVTKILTQTANNTPLAFLFLR